MHSTTKLNGLKGISLIGIALVLAACAKDLDGTSDSSEAPATPSLDSERGDAPSETDKKQREARDALSPVNPADRWKRSGGDENLVADARAFATDVARRAGAIDPRFHATKVTKGQDGLVHVRLEQQHALASGESLKVWGADVVVHATEAELFGLVGSIAPGVTIASAKARAEGQLDSERALAMARAARFGADRIVKTSREEVERIVYVDRGGEHHVALHTTFYNELDGDIAPGLWNHVFDESTGELLAKWNGIDTLSQASGAGGNAKYTHSWIDELDVEPSGSNWVMSTTRLRTVNMANAQSGGTDYAAPITGFNDAAINDAHGYAEITLNMLKDWFGHNSIDDNGFKIVSRVHYGVQYENAFWNGVQMTYGDGRNTFHPLSGALDVVAHEIHHGFTSKHSNLAYSGEAGGLNEGFSDVAGKTAEFFYKTSGHNWDLGGDIFKQPTGALRYMCTPSKDGRSIESAAQMTPSLDPHYSSGVPNKAFCRLSKRLSGADPATGTATKEGVKRAAATFFLANSEYWTSGTTFTQGCQGTVDAARALGYTAEEVSAIKASWADVGVFCDGGAAPAPACDQTLTGATGELTSPNYPNNYGDRFAKTWCIDAPAGRTVTVSFTDFVTESGYDFVTILDKNGAQLSKTSGATTRPPNATSSRVYVVWKTDESVVKKGWKATWTTN